MGHLLLNVQPILRDSAHALPQDCLLDLWFVFGEAGQPEPGEASPGSVGGVLPPQDWITSALIMGTRRPGFARLLT